MKGIIAYILPALLFAAVYSCGYQDNASGPAEGNTYASYFRIIDSAVVSVSPFTGETDTLAVPEPFDNIVCMSSSYAACFSASGCDSIITGISGERFVSSPGIRARKDSVLEVGYESTFDYEAVMRLRPDVVLAYSVNSSLPAYVRRLESLGVNVLVLYDHLENHPLARAEYIRLAGALTGRQEYADSVFDRISDRYRSMAQETAEIFRNSSGKAGRSGRHRAKVLLNLPYADIWYVPGECSYMSRLIYDAGGEVLGAERGRSVSSSISVEEAYALSEKADFWLNPGSCRSREEISSLHPLFQFFGPMKKHHSIFNNIALMNDAGGNDFWESGAVRPDLVLEDLVRIFRGDNPVSDSADISDGTAGGLHYYIEVK